MQLVDYKNEWNKLAQSATYDIGWARYAYSLLLDSEKNLPYDDFAVQQFGLKATDFAMSVMSYMLGNGMGGSELDALMWKYHLFRAPWNFESYLLYLEKDRMPSSKFYEPKRKQLNKHGLIQSMQDLEDDKLDLLSISMPPGTQKCQPLYSKVLTPDGFVPMGDIHVGSKVISGTGKVSTVLTESEVKKRPIYEVIFDDGSRTRCSDNHIWHVQTRDDRRRGNKYRNVELKDMLHNLYVESGKRKNYSVDYVPKIDFTEKDFYLHPYVVGALIGNGGLTSGGVLFSSRDVETIVRVNDMLPSGYTLRHHDKCTYRVHGRTGKVSTVRVELDRLGLMDKLSAEKHIPKDYLYASYEQRLWLLRGLLDTDGYAQSGYAVYCTVSEQLSKDVIELVHSLGGYASATCRKAGYKKDGEYIRCRDAYHIHIQFAKGMDDIFALERKRRKYAPRRECIKRFITEVNYIGEEDCKCIYIDDPSHLYITDDYIITHNTTALKFFASWVIGKHIADYSLFFSHSGDITRMFYDGVLDIIDNSIEYKWHEIFPSAKITKTDAKREQINLNNYKPFPNLQTSSVGSKNAGKVRCNRYLFCDDLIGGIEEALSKPRLDKLWGIYSVDARQRKLNEQVKEIHIATRWSVYDVIGRLKDIYGNSDRARFIAVPDIDPETGESNFDYEYNGMSTQFFHDQEMVMDEISYKCLYKNEPIEREGLLYHEDDIKRYLELPIQPPDAVLSIADTKNKGTDYFAQPVFLQYGDDYYMVDAICSNESDYEIQYERSTSLIIRNKVEACHFESNNGGDRVSFEVNKRLKDKGYFCNITQEYTTANKETKIIVYAPWVKQHVYFMDKSKYTAKSDYGEFMSQLLSYSVASSNRGQHDDCVDVLASFAKRQNKKPVEPARVINSPF